MVSIMPGCKVSSSFHAAGDLSIIWQKIFPSEEDGQTKMGTQTVPGADIRFESCP